MRVRRIGPRRARVPLEPDRRVLTDRLGRTARRFVRLIDRSLRITPELEGCPAPVPARLREVPLTGARIGVARNPDDLAARVTALHRRFATIVAHSPLALDSQPLVDVGGVNPADAADPEGWNPALREPPAHGALADGQIRRKRRRSEERAAFTNR